MNLEESERLIRTATSALSECVSLQIEESKSRSQETESQSNLSAFDQHILYLETQLKDAKIKASHSLQIMEECDKAQETLMLEPSPLQLSTTNNMFENEANNNNTSSVTHSTEVMLEGVSDN